MSRPPASVRRASTSRSTRTSDRSSHAEAKGIAPAADIVSKHQQELVDKITYWTGVKRPIVRGLIDSICRTCTR
jgi:hypothetical protein